MPRKAFSVYVIPAEHRAAANIAVALVNGDNPITSDAFSVPANASGDYNDPHTHFYGGMSTTLEWEAAIGNLAAQMVPGDWPYGEVTEADAIAAATAMKLQITVTQDGSEPDPLATLTNALDALGLKLATVAEA